MVSSRYDRVTYEYETKIIDADILSRLNNNLDSRQDLIESANEESITLYHLTWIKSFGNFIEEIDPLGDIDTWSNEHSDSLVKSWHLAKYPGNYSSHDIEARGLSEKYLDAKIFHQYLSVLLQLKNGRARIVKSKQKQEAKAPMSGLLQEAFDAASKLPALQQDMLANMLFEKMKGQLTPVTV